MTIIEIKGNRYVVEKVVEEYEGGFALVLRIPFQTNQTANRVMTDLKNNGGIIE